MEASTHPPRDFSYFSSTINTLCVNNLICKCDESKTAIAKFEGTLVSQKKAKVLGILFDLDGTIVDSRISYCEAAKVAFAALGKNLPPLGTILEIPKRLERGLPIDDLVGYNEKFFLEVYLKTYYSITKSKTKLIPNVKGTLASLSKNVKLALITMRFVPKSAVVDELREFGLASFFTYVVTALDTHKPKPSPEALIDTVRALDLKLCDCMMVGDSVTDVRAGKAAGIITVAVLSGLFSKEELSKEQPELILNNVTELPLFLDFSIK